MYVLEPACCQCLSKACGVLMGSWRRIDWFGENEHFKSSKSIHVVISLFIIVSVQIMHVILSISHFLCQTIKFFFFLQIVSSTSECSWLLYIDLVSYDLDKLSDLNSFSIDSFLFFHVHNHVTYKIKAVFFFHLPVLARTQHTHPGCVLHLGHVWEEHPVLYC